MQKLSRQHTIEYNAIVSQFLRKVNKKQKISLQNKALWRNIFVKYSLFLKILLFVKSYGLSRDTQKLLPTP